MKCNKCNLDKEEICFAWKGKGKRNTICKACVNSYNKHHYQCNKTSYIAKARKYDEKVYKQRKQYIEELKSAPCVDCKNNYPPCVMDFDHLTNKSFTLANNWMKVSFKRLMEELRKCEIVCANCHRIRTFIIRK